MGYFSWDCNGCGFSLRVCKSCSVDNWMAQTVALFPNGGRYIGHYDEYGGVGDSLKLHEQRGDFAVYHQACWELAGKPDFDRQSSHARDQGACHALHGQPFPLPTKEWMEQARMWRSINAVLNSYGQLLCDIDYAREEGLWKSLTPERQLAVCDEYETAKRARSAHNKARWEEYLRSEVDDEMPPEKEPDPKHYNFDGIVFDYMWLGHFISMAKKDR